MSAEPRSLRTEAEQTLSEQYRAARDRLPGGPAVLARRDTAIAAFERAGLPHRRVEAWKYTDLRALMRHAAPVAPQPPVEAVRLALLGNALLHDVDRHRLVLADGHFQPELSDVEALKGEGVEVVPLSAFLGFDSPAVTAILDAPDGAEDDAVLALNTAFATDGVILIVPADCTVSKPIEILHLTTGTEGVAWSTRSAIQVGRNAKLQVYVTRTGSSGGHQSNSVVGLAASEGARVTMVDVQATAPDAQDLATFSARIAAGAEFDHVAVVAGAHLSRLQGFVSLEGEDARAGLFGANMLRGTSHGDVSLVLEHRTPQASSRVFYRNVADDEGTGAFQGRIVVHPDAQKTDGRMMTNTLLLSDAAEFAAKPELEIYADDVQCGHGATTGQFDESMLFYILSRGIPRPEAEALLLRAFLSEGIAAAGDEAVAAALEPVLSGWLEARA